MYVFIKANQDIRVLVLKKKWDIYSRQAENYRSAMRMELISQYVSVIFVLRVIDP